METFHEMRNTLLKLYNNALLRYPLTEEEEEKFIEDEELSDNEINRINDILDSINRMSTIDRENFILLLLLTYYMSAMCVKVEYEDEDLDEEEPDEIIELLNTSEIEFVLDFINSENNIDLFDLVLYVLQEDTTHYTDLGITNITDYDEYNAYNELLAKGINIDEIIEKIHPNVEKEKIRYKKSLHDKEIIKKYSKEIITDYYEFVQLYMIVKQNTYSVSSRVDFITSVLYKNKDNKELIKTINLFMLKYIYLKNYYRNKSNLEDLKLELSKKLHNPELVEDSTKMEFLDYDNLIFMAGYYKLLDDEKKKIDELISLDNLRTFGISGIWKKYDITDRNLLLMHSPEWISYIENTNNCDVYIYYSIDSNGEYKIPRLCIFMKDNKVISAFGIRNKFNIELEMADILDGKVQEYNYNKELMQDILSLKFIRYIKSKIDNDEELTRVEFEYLYGIDGNINCMLLDKYDNIIFELRRNKNRRKYIASYFGCLESEVALTLYELNENTVVTTIFRPIGISCYYPKLRAIFGTCNAYTLEDAKGLSSLEFILENAQFNNLLSSEGLDNLTFIGGDAYFYSLEDTSYLNRNINIMGEFKFKDGYEPGFTLKK